MLRLRVDAAGDGQRGGFAHGPEAEAQAVPAEIAEATERLECAVSADVGVRKTVIGKEAELAGDVLDPAHLGVEHLRNRCRRRPCMNITPSMN